MVKMETVENEISNASDLGRDPSDADYPAEFLDDNGDGYIDEFAEINEDVTEPEMEFESDLAADDLPAAKRKRSKTRSETSSESTFDFMISCYKKEFRGQHHDKGKTAEKLICKEFQIFGNSPDEVLEQTWEAVRSYIRREVIVYDDQNFKKVKWAGDTDPEFKDMDKYVLFKDLQRKRTYRASDLQEKSDVMVKWRGKVVDVYLHIYSMAVANQKLYDLVKRLEAPDDPDRAGAWSNKSFQGLINELKSLHPEVSADSFVWNNWAEHVEAAPGYRREFVKQNPPDDIRSFLKPAPNDDSGVLEENRRGLLLAQTIVRAMEKGVKELREHSVQLSATASQIEERISGMEIQLKSYNEMLTSMQRSLAPVESELSRTLASSVTDADDVDHS